MEVPKDGVTSKPLTDDDLNENLDDKGKEKPWLKVPVKGEFAALPAAPVQAEREATFGNVIKVEVATKPVESPKPARAAEHKPLA